MLLLDLGGTRLKARAGNRATVVEVPRAGGLDAIVEMLRSAADELGAKAPDAVAMCLPGSMDADGVLVSLPGKLEGLEGVDIVGMLRETFGASRVVVAHDAAAYAIGEALGGAGRGAARVVVVTIGTGVGVTVVEDGRLLGEGMWGAGKLGGFIPIAAEEGPADSNGTTGTIEALCASNRIAEACGTAGVEQAYAAFAAGDEAALHGIDAYRRVFVRALIALAHAHGPDRIVIGGGPMTAGNPITPGIEELVGARLFRGYRVEVRLAALGDEAALTGLEHIAGAP